jgi:hypothetical protein
MVHSEKIAPFSEVNLRKKTCDEVLVLVAGESATIVFYGQFEIAR